jgi:secreted trypsin-like serine protease
MLRVVPALALLGWLVAPALIRAVGAPDIVQGEGKATQSAQAPQPEAQITNAPIRDEPEAAVRLEFLDPGVEYGSCTGVVISKHWLITAAHCVRDAIAKHGVHKAGRLTIRYGVDGRDGGAESYTNGGASFYMHPSFDGSNGDVGDDFALIRLHGNGMSVFSKATIMGETDACFTPSSIGHPRVTGYGIGTPRSGGKACSDSPNKADGWKRSGQFKSRGMCGVNNIGWSPGAPARTVVTVDSSERTACSGDSGGPIYFKYDGREIIAALFAANVTVLLNDSQRGPSIRRKLQWMIDTSEDEHPALVCRPGYSDVGPDWWSCFDYGEIEPLPRR